MPLTGRNTLEIPPRTPGFLERLQVATELVAHLLKPPDYSVTEKEPIWWLLRTDKIILTFYQNITPGLGWELVGVLLQLFPLLGIPTPSSPFDTGYLVLRSASVCLRGLSRSCYPSGAGFQVASQGRGESGWTLGTKPKLQA